MMQKAFYDFVTLCIFVISFRNYTNKMGEKYLFLITKYSPSKLSPLFTVTVFIHVGDSSWKAIIFTYADNFL